MKAHKVMQRGCCKFDNRLSPNYHKFVILCMLIHQERILVFDIYQKCPVPLRVCSCTEAISHNGTIISPDNFYRIILRLQCRIERLLYVAQVYYFLYIMLGYTKWEVFGRILKVSSALRLSRNVFSRLCNNKLPRQPDGDGCFLWMNGMRRFRSQMTWIG